MASLRSRLILIAIGIGLGILARMTFGGPNGNNERPLFDPLPNDRESVPDLPIDNRPLSPDQNDGLIPAIDISGASTSVDESDPFWGDNAFIHDDRAAFHPHGTQVCATGCAVSNHPTESLSREQFQQLLTRYSNEPLDETSTALEELLFYGRQTRALINQFGDRLLDDERSDFLRDQLKYTHALVSIRVVDETGEIRTWIPPTRVPFDRRHVFEMETHQLQPLVTSGTVKRVGLNHLWTRL